MLTGHLLLATVALCCLPALSQDAPLISENAGAKALQAPDFRTVPPAKPDEPWRIIPKSDKDKRILITPDMDGKSVSPDGPLATDFTCLSIRSYVVKRDSKNSDSVHPAGYTTCVPAKRFRLKTADATEAVSLTR
ncbi:MAG TPA: hypothetical protein VF123_15540 [Candidatus Sulfotelmatobacter sp.]